MPAKKNTSVDTTTATKSTSKSQYLPLAEAKVKFVELLEKHGKLSRSEAKPLMEKLGFPPQANWTKLCRELEEEGAIRKDVANKEEGEKYGQYVLTSPAKGKGGKGKGTKRAAASTSAHKAGRPTATQGSGTSK